MSGRRVWWLAWWVGLAGCVGCAKKPGVESADSSSAVQIEARHERMIDAAGKRQAAYCEESQQERVVANSIGMRLVLIPPGTFEQAELGMRELPGPGGERVAVDIPEAYRMSETEVTQAQYEAVTGERPARFTGDDYPVEQISWEEAQEFCRRLSNLDAERAAGRIYRLPTEAEWEYACRADVDAAYCFGDDPALLSQVCSFRRPRWWIHQRQNARCQRVGAVLSHVPWPVVGPQHAHSIGSDAAHGLRVLFSTSVSERTREHHDVLPSLPQGRDTDRNDG